jgi:Bacteriophage lambda head decoration protein D
MLTAILRTDSDVVKTEGRNRISRDEAVIASGSGILDTGTVLGRLTASGKYRPLTPGASDGSQIAVAVTLQKADATSADAPRTVILARKAEVVDQAMVWPNSITNNQKAAAIAQLEEVGIVARKGI